MKKTKGTNKNRLVNGALISSAVALFFASNASATSNTGVLGNAFEVRGNIIEKNSCADKNFFEMKCGAETGVKDKSAGKNDVKTPMKEKAVKKGKTAESKCGEGKCGTKDKKASTKKSENKSDKKSKTTESKCGQGKCGVS